MLGQSSLRPHTCGSNSRAAGGVQQRFVVTRAKKQGSRPGFSTGPTQPRNPNLYNLPPIDPSAPGGSPPQPPQQQQGATTAAPPYGQPMQGAPQGPPAAVPLTVPPGQQQQQQQQRRPQGAPNGQPGWAQPAVQNPAQPGFITQPGFTTQQPGFNTQQQPGFNTQQQAGFNTQQQPGFTTQQPKQQPGFTTQQPQQTQQPMQQPGFTTQPPKQQPGFNTQQQPGFINQQQPGFINQQPMQQQGYTNQQQPGFINQQQPGFNNQQQPGFMNQQQPGFGNAPGTQPGFTTAPGAPQGSGFQQPLDPALSNFAQPGFQQQPGQQNGGYINTNQQNGGFVQQPGLQNGGYMNTNPNGGYLNTNQQNGGYMTGQQNGGYMMPNTDRWQQGGQQQGYPRQQQQQQQSWADLGSDQGGYINDQGGFIDAGRGNQGNTGGYITQRGGWGQQGGQRNNRNQQQQQPQMFLNEGGYMNDMPNRSWGNPQRNNKPGFAGFDNTNTWTEDFLLKTLEGQLRPNQQYQLQEWVEEVEQEEDLTPKYVNGKRVLVNSEIDASQVRVQDANKADVGVMAFEAAREMSISQDMDVVMITEDADPPVVRIIAFSKYKYEMEKTAKQKQKASKGPEIKEVKLRPVTEKADYDTKVKQAQKFLSKGAKVKLTMTFSGREMRFKDQGKEMMLKLIEELSTDSKMEAPLALRPSNFSVTLVPLK